MATSRYGKTAKFKNDNDLYKKTLKDRDVEFIRQYRTPKFSYPSDEEMSGLDAVAHVWSIGDQLYKLAFKHYGNGEMWWVIAWFNKKPSEGLYNIGDTVYIPFPIERALEMMER